MDIFLAFASGFTGGSGIGVFVFTVCQCENHGVEERNVSDFDLAAILLAPLAVSFGTFPFRCVVFTCFLFL